MTRTVGRFFGMLDRLGATPTSYARLGFEVARTGATLDLARHWQEESEAGDA